MRISQRVGMVAEKVGMTSIFDDGGALLPVTLLRVEGNVVVGVKTSARDGYYAVQLGFGKAKPGRVAKPQKGVFAKADIEPMKVLREFRVSQDALLEVGRSLSVDHFIMGQYVDVSGVSIGKGFAGAMKRHNFGGLRASHGVSVSHRSHGSTGQCQDPGKVFKGKKMAGHMGAASVTVQNLKVVLSDIDNGVLGVLGSVPGYKGSNVLINDAVKFAIPSAAAFPASLVGIVKEEKEGVCSVASRTSSGVSDLEGSGSDIADGLSGTPKEVK